MPFNVIGLPEPVRRFEADGFTLTERFHSRNRMVAKHDHGVPIIGFALKGYFIESADGRSYECSPYGLQILPAGEQHSYKFGLHPVHCITVEVKVQKLEGIRRFSDILDSTSYIGGQSLCGLLKKLYKEFRAGDSACALTVEGIVLETLGAATLNTRYRSLQQPKWLRDVKDFIHAHFAEKLSLTELAAFAEVHPAHLMRAFRKHYGSPIGDYIRRIRLNYTLDQLATPTSLAEIATAAGFYDQSHFTRCFKLDMGMTPTEYRASIRLKHR